MCFHIKSYHIKTSALTLSKHHTNNLPVLPLLPSSTVTPLLFSDLPEITPLCLPQINFSVQGPDSKSFPL